MLEEVDNKEEEERRNRGMGTDKEERRCTLRIL